MAALIPGSIVTPSLRLVRPLGAGGMGSVWIADHLGLRTRVVVKVISEALAKQPDVVARFQREAAAAAAVKSPHVVHMVDYGLLADGTPFIAMELLDGEDLGHRLAATRVLPPRQVARIIAQVSKALARAHASGVVHRDIKPDNIFLADGGGDEAFVKVLDFGIAKTEAAQALGHTRTGAVLGTPLYMSPEQMVGAKHIDHRTDLWSLGVVAFEALIGRRPFERDTLGGLALAICHEPLPRLADSSSSLPSEMVAALDAWFGRACARDPGSRFATATELAAAFEAAVGGSDAVPFVQAAPIGEPTPISSTARADDHTLPVPEASDVLQSAHSPAPAAASLPSTTTGGVAEDAQASRPLIPRRRWRAAAITAAAFGIVLSAAMILMRSSSSATTPPLAAPAPPAASFSAVPPPVDAVDAGQYPVASPNASSVSIAETAVPRPVTHPAGRPLGAAAGVAASTKGAAPVTAASSGTPPPTCKIVTYFDGDGNKRFKQECK